MKEFFQKEEGFIPTPIGDPASGNHQGAGSMCSVPYISCSCRKKQKENFHPRWMWGFTVIELLVSLGLFSIIVLLAMGGFVRALRAQGQVAAFASTNSNMSLALEEMAREIRTGILFCTNGTTCGSVLSFVNARRQVVTYCLDEDAIKRGIADTTCANGQKVTADNIAVKYLTFILFGNHEGDGYPPRITILVGAGPRDPAAASYIIHFQTTVSSRIPDS